MRRNTTKIILEAMFKALFENNHTFGYRELKRKIESESYLNRKDTLIPFDTYESCICRLEDACILLPRPKNRDPGKKVTLQLTNKAKLKYILGILEVPESNKIRKNTKRMEESKEERQQKLIQLILFFDAAENQIHEVPAYEKEKIEKILSVMGIHSLDDLSVEYIHKKDSDSVITTVYESVSCIKISKREIPSSRVLKIDNIDFDNIDAGNNVDKSNSNDTLPWNTVIKRGSSPNHEEKRQEEKDQSIVFYYIRILGVSVNDILSRHRYKFRNIEFTRNEVQMAFDSLNKLKIIQPIGFVDNEERYTIADESLSNFIGECWNVHNLLMEKMNVLWLYDDRPKNREKREWLGKIYDYKEVERRIIDDYDFRRSLDKRNKNKDSMTIKQHIEVFSEIAKQEYKILTEKYKNTINKNTGSVAEELLEIIYPKYLQHLDKIQDYKKRKKNKSKIYRSLSKKNRSLFL